METNGYAPDTAFEWPDGQTRVVGNTATRANGFPAMGVDWWHVRLRAGTAYRVQLRRPSFGPEDGGYRYLSIYDSLANAQGNNYWSRQYRNGDDGYYFPSISWTPSGTGVQDWWIKVDDGNNGFNGYRGEYLMELTPRPVPAVKVEFLAHAGRATVRRADSSALLYRSASPGGGVTCALRPTPVDNNWYGVCWSPELALFAAVAVSGSNNRVMTSPDGANWTVQTTPNSNNWRSICWSPERGLFVAVAYSGTNRVMTSPDGINWTARASGNESGYWYSVCWSPELRLFAAVAYSGTYRIMTSPDGVDWTARTAPQSGYWGSVCWSPERRLFVAVAYSGTYQIMTSPDGATWTAYRAPAANAWQSVCWSAERGVFVAVASSGTGNRVMYSRDGVVWHLATMPVENNWQSVCWSPERGVFLAVALSGSGNRAAVSPDGFNWTLCPTPADYYWYAACWSPEREAFVAVAYSGSGHRAMTVEVAPAVERPYHAIERAEEIAVAQNARVRSYVPTKPVAYRARLASLREKHPAASVKIRNGIRADTATAQIHAEAKSDFSPLQNPKNADLVAAWPMAEESGDRFDLSPHRRTLSAVGHIAASDGLNGRAALMPGTQTSGSSNFFQCPNPFFGGNDTAGTLSFWLRPNDNYRQVAVAGGQGTGDQWDFILYSSSNMYWRWGYGVEGNGIYSEIYCPGAPTGAWTHVALRWLGTYWELFHNGSRHNSRSDSAFDMRKGEYWRFGARFDWYYNGYYPYNGLLDEVYVWNRSLTDAEIAELYAGGSGRFMDKRAAADPLGGYHRIAGTRRAAHFGGWRLDAGSQIAVRQAASWRVIDGVAMPYANAGHGILYPRGHRLFARDTATDELRELGVAADDPENPGGFVLPNVSLPDGVYEIEARPTDAFWRDALSRRVATVRLQAGETPTPELPAVTDLTARLDHYAGAVWRVLEWSPALDDATATDYAFGIWLSSDAPPNPADPPTEQIPRRAWLNRYEHYLRQTIPVYVAVAALAPDGTRGREARLFLDWSSERPVAPGRQWAELATP